MSERTRKRVFRRRLGRIDIAGDSQDELQRLVDEANGYLFLMTELDAELQQYAGQTPVEKHDSRDVTGDDVKGIDNDSVAYLQQIAGLDGKPEQDVEIEGETEQVNDRAHCDCVDDRLWDDFVMERAARKVNNVQKKEKKSKSRLMRFITRLFGKRKAREDSN